MSLKYIVKKILQKNTSPITHNNLKYNTNSKALNALMEEYPELQDEKIAMTKENPDNPFDPIIRKMLNGYDLVNFELDKYGDDNVIDPYHEALSSGDAIKYKPYPPAAKSMILTAFSSSLNIYPSTVGSSQARQELVDYLIKEGFPAEENDYCEGIDVHNVAFCGSTTQAFHMILKVIAKPGDVIIVPVPTYGIFAGIAEKQQIHLESILLKPENDYYVDAKELSEKIDKVNQELKAKGTKQYGYIPKVVAFLNINPHNPIGNVMSIDQIDLIKELGDVCLEKGVFIIDDLVYRDLTYDHNKLAYPIGSIPKYFNNTISLFGLSKSFGLASLRAGFVVVPKPIFWGFATEIFDFMDSMCVSQVNAVKATFNGTDKRYKEYDNYFKKLLPKYLYQLDLVCALIDGIDTIKNNQSKRKIINDVQKYTKDKELTDKILKGINGVKLVPKTYPQSGFFVMVDFTDLKGKYYRGRKIETEYDLLKAMYNKGKVRYLTGENIMWSNPNEFVARINFAISKEALIHYFYQIKQLVGELKDE